MSQATNATQSEGYFNDLMALYDKRIVYFGNDPRYGTNWIVNRKASDYMNFKGGNADPAVLYGWLKPIVDDFKDKTEPNAISLFIFASQSLMALDADKHLNQFIQDFLNASALYDMQLETAKAANDETAMTNITAYKSQIESRFAISGAADCETMERIFAPKIEAGKGDLETLKTTMALFQRVGCTESDAYFAAANYSHKIEPTAESAMGIAYQAVKKSDYATAEKYFIEATEMTTDDKLKTSANFSIASLAAARNQYPKAKQYCLKALETNANYGRAYYLIAQAYAASANSIYPDDGVLKKTVFWAAVDKLEKAKQVDPDLAADANKLISQYRNFFPSTEEVFMHPDLTPGSSFTVGGWINERTTVR
jgi:tetratricopeptide (TPR) repeat protein